VEWVKVLQEESVITLNDATTEVKDLSVEDIDQNEKIVTDSADPKVTITQTETQTDDKNTITPYHSTEGNNQTLTNVSFAGGGDVGIVGGDGVSLSSVSFVEGGHICNINAHMASRNVATSVGATSASDNTFSVSGGSGAEVTATVAPTLPQGSIKIPLSAYMNNDINGGFVSHMRSLVNDMPNARSTLNGYKLVRWYDGRDYFVPNAGVNKFTFQDGWFKSNNGLLAIGQDNAKDLVLTNSPNLTGNIAKILNPSSNLSVFGGDNKGKIIPDYTDINTKIYSSEKAHKFNITSNVTGSDDSLERDPSTREYISAKSYIGTSSDADELNIAHRVTIANTLISTGSGKDRVNFKGTSADRVDFNRSVLMTGADDDEINIEHTLLRGAGSRVSEIKTGDGNDVIIAKKLIMNSGSTINSGNGDDTITIGAQSYIGSDSMISGGAGNDKIFIKDGTRIDGRSSILGDGRTQRPGNDEITISGNNTLLENMKIDAGDGDENAENGPKDIINIKGGKITTSSVISGDGNDEITINGNAIMETVYVDSGNGKDKITIGGNANIDGGDYRAGNGEDEITITDDAKIEWLNFSGGEDNDTININGNAKVQGGFIGAGAGTDDKINISGNAEVSSAFLKLGASSYNSGKTTDKTTLNVTGDAVIDGVTILSGESLGKQVMNFHQNGEAKLRQINGSNNKDVIDIAGNFTVAGTIDGNGGDDEINIHNGATAKFTANMGEGKDILTVENATLKDSVVDMYNGIDKININSGAKLEKASINAGAGEDIIKVKGKSATDEDRIVFNSSTLDTGADNDIVEVANTTFKNDGPFGDFSSINTGDGDDVITIKDGTIFQDVSYIVAGNGIDTITLESGAKFNEANVYADAGDDIINVNGAEFKGDNVHNHNAGIHGGAGGDTIFVNSGKFDNARIEGDAGDDTIHIKAGARFENSSIYGDNLLYETGNDTIIVEKGAILTNTTIDGGAGYDILKIADDSVDLTKVTNIEKLDLTEGNHNITLTAKDVLDMTDSNNRLRIDGDNGDNVTLQGWLKDTNPTSDGYTVYTKVEGSHTVTLEIKDVVVHEI
jgi:putative DNA (cytosine-5-)-methyltransferase